MNRVFGLTLAAACALAAGLIAAPNGPTTIENDWRKVDEETWSVLSNEPLNHLANAVAAYEDQNYEVAAEHLRVASGFIELRRQTLGRAQEKLDAVSDQVRASDPNAAARLSEAVSVTRDVLNGGRWLPLGSGLTDVIGQEPQFHFTRAKAQFEKKNLHGAAAEIRKAAIFMRFDAQTQSADAVAPAVRQQFEDLQMLAARVARGRIKSLKVLEREFEDARQVIQQQSRG